MSTAPAAAPTPFKPMQGHMTLDPGGIEVFAALMHCVFAHANNPVRVGDAEHHKGARDYIRAHQRSVAVDCLGADAASATYSLGRQGRSPLIVRIQLGKPAHEALLLQTQSNVWVPLDLRLFHVRTVPVG